MSELCQRQVVFENGMEYPCGYPLPCWRHPDPITPEGSIVPTPFASDEQDVDIEFEDDPITPDLGYEWCSCEPGPPENMAAVPDPGCPIHGASTTEGASDE